MADSAAGGAQAPDDANPDQEPEPDQEHEPDECQAQTRQELYAYYSGKGPASMCFDFLSDPFLQGHCIIMVWAAEPLERLYQTTLQQMKTPLSQMIFAAERCRTGHFKTAMECATMFCNDSLLARLGFPPGMSEVGVVPKIHLDTATKESREYVLHKLIFKYGMTLASEIAWSFMHFHWQFPYCVAAALNPDKKARERGLEHALEMAKAVAAAEAVESPKADLKLCLTHLSFNSEYICRVLMQKGLQAGFGSKDVTDWAVANWASTGSTKEVLESAFNNINRQVGFATTAKIASHPMKWLLTTQNPFLKASGINQFVPEESDWWQCLRSPAGLKMLSEWENRWFDINSFKLPEPEAEKPGDLDADEGKVMSGASILAKMNFKPAGADAMRRSTAAAAYLVSDYKNGFQNVGFCWSGRSLL